MTFVGISLRRLIVNYYEMCVALVCVLLVRSSFVERVPISPRIVVSTVSYTLSEAVAAIHTMNSRFSYHHHLV